MPGGWCEFNLSPADNIVKETKEEAGLDVFVKMVIAVQDRDKHNPPPYAYGVVKIFYLCGVIGGEFAENIETSELMVQLMPEKYKGIHIMMDYKQERIMTLGELTSEWWIG